MSGFGRALEAVVGAGGPLAALGQLHFEDPWWLLGLAGLGWLFAAFYSPGGPHLVIGGMNIAIGVMFVAISRLRTRR